MNEHRDFYVRRDKIFAALTFLKLNNPYYADINIDYKQISQLPANDSILNKLPSVEVPEINENQNGRESGNDSVYESFIPSDVKLQEIDRVKSTVNNVVSWPTSTNIINEFSCEGYISMAFPTLFPYGLAEFNDKTRPQNMKLSALEYFQFLLQYKDKRFAQDPRFRFFALNMIQRHDAIKRGTVFAKKSHFNGTLQELREIMPNNPNIVRSLYFWCGKIRGSNSFWYQRRGELETMVNQLGIPTVFLTLSAADLWWPDLARLLGGSDLVHENILTESQIAQQRQKLLNEIPMIIEQYFTYRAKMFMDNVVCKRYNVIDYWFRFEFQHRGSCHLHGVLWLLSAPKPKDFDRASKQQILNAKRYYDNIMSAFNPLLFIPQATVHPSRIRSTDIDLDDNCSISESLNKFQRHTKCTKEYCLKWNGQAYLCRFKFPKEIQQESALEKDEKGHWTYTPKRNDELLNPYNSFITQTWRANTDFQVITSEYAIVNYIAKYASKSEPASNNLAEMFEEIVKHRSGNDQPRSAYINLMMKIIGERDIGACETCHLLLSIPLFHCTRSFQVLVIKSEDYVVINETNDECNNSGSFIEFYCQRPNEMLNSSLYEFAKKHSKGRRNSLSKCRKERIVQIYPKVNKDLNEFNFDLYCKQQLMLHVPWRTEKDLRNENESWRQAYARHNPSEEGIQINMSLASEDSEVDIYNPVHDNFNDRDWMAVAAAMPHALPAHVRLGNRDIDLHHNWSAAYQNYVNIKHNINFIEKNRENPGHRSEHLQCTNITFNDQQNKILSFLERQILMYDNCSDKLAIIQGKAGTGKSCVINEMVHRINSYYRCDATLLLAPTGVAANNINGQTIHSALKIPAAKGAITDLSGDVKLELQEIFTNIKFIIIDEASMLGLNLFLKVDKRLREVKPLSSHLPFGGLCVHLVGDWSQLLPVCDASLYNTGKNSNTIQASFLYTQFKKVFFLTEIMRQQGEEQKCFRDTLNRIADGRITSNDYELLSSRFHVNNINDNSFKNAICIMSKNIEIDRFNYEKLENINQPVALINAIHNCQEACVAPSDDAQGLLAELRLCIGARVILRRNLWVAKGLANGSIGTVTDIIYDPTIDSENYNDCMPLCILVNFDKYTGPTIYGKSVPVAPMTSSFKYQGISCTRKQFPLMLAYAISVHRSQGITLDRAIVDIGETEFQVGLTYVALSRVKTLNGLLLKPAFNFDRLQKINNSTAMVGRQNELQRLRNISSSN